MSTQEKTSKVDVKQLESLISNAIKKISAKKENDICRYLPSPTGGYIHHFTMRKMKTEAPDQLAQMISKYIVNAPKPLSVTPKQRAPRGSRKRKDQFIFSKVDIDRLLHMARSAGDHDMIRKLTPKKDLRSAKRELIASIRHSKIDLELWNCYIEAINHQTLVSQHAEKAHH